MTVLSPVLASARASAWRAALRQLLIVILTNVPILSFGLSLAWVSGASGARGDEARAAVAGGALATHAAAVLGVGAAAALRGGRKPPLLAASAAAALCWALKLAGGAPCLLAARLAAGLAGAAAWTAAPLLGREVSNGAVRGAASAAPVLAHNIGFLLMYIAADAGVPNRVILWSCLALSATHCVVFLFAPESPAYLAATGQLDAARGVLSWLRAAPPDCPALEKELHALPPAADVAESPFAVIRELWQDRRRRRALLVGVAAVAGQESCGLLALLQFAEPVFSEAAGSPERAATHALLLGAVQLVASAAALYLLERVGRKPLIAWSALACGLSLGCGAGLAWAGTDAAWLAGALSVAVAADSLGMQPAPYALLADMFHYRYRGCALALATAASAFGNALEVLIFGAVAATGVMSAAILLAAVLTLLYAAFGFRALPETRGREPDEIYDILGPGIARDLTVDAEAAKLGYRAPGKSGSWKVISGQDGKYTGDTEAVNVDYRKPGKFGVEAAKAEVIKSHVDDTTTDTKTASIYRQTGLEDYEKSTDQKRVEVMKVNSGHGDKFTGDAEAAPIDHQKYVFLENSRKSINPPTKVINVEKLQTIEATPLDPDEKVVRSIAVDLPVNTDLKKTMEFDNQRVSSPTTVDSISETPLLMILQTAMAKELDTGTNAGPEPIDAKESSSSSSVTNSDKEIQTQWTSM